MNEKQEFFDILSKNINYININGVVLSGGAFDVKCEKSINNCVINRLYFKNKIVKIKNTKINYKCSICNENNTILLKRFLSKKSSICGKCKESDSDKRKKAKEYAINNGLEYKLIFTQYLKDFLNTF
jgi:hypothetical protein